ncbi:MAG: hypothetical protein LLG04_15215, partial [Parachlamydia sp.]|nr:hypothetical protein [Parachlamydia sp.]
MISATSLAILEKILDLKIHNDHPDFKMIRLHAFGLLVRQKQQGAKEPVKEFFDKEENEEMLRLAELIKDLPKLMQGANNLSIYCRMEREEEIFLVRLIIQEGKQKLNALISINPTYPFENVLESIAERLEGSIKQTRQTESVTRVRNKPRGRGYGRNFVNRIELVDPSLPPPSSITDPSKMAEYRQKLDRALSLLDKGLEEFDPNAPLTYPFSRPPAEINPNHNGRLFLEVLHIVRSGNRDRILEMLLRMKMWRENESNASPYLDCMVTVLLNADHFRGDIDSRLFKTELETQGKWCQYLSLRKIQDRYATCAKPNSFDILSIGYQWREDRRALSP